MGRNIEFQKFAGYGNDFVIVDNMDLKYKPEDHSTLVEEICKRKFSIGADGMIFIEPSKQYDWKFSYYDGAGMRADMCGNGSRCAAKFAYLHGICGTTTTFEIDTGYMRAFIHENEVTAEFSDVPLDVFKTNRTIVIDGQEITYSYVFQTNDQAMVYLDAQLSHQDIMRIGSQMRYNQEHFPQGANINFLVKTDDHTLELITYERGNEQICLACGTGSIAAATTANVVLGMESPICVKNLGGDITISFENDGTMMRHIQMKGEAKLIATGVIE